MGLEPTDPICLSPPEADSEGSGEVYMVGNGEELLDNRIEEIQQETDIERARAAHLAREAKRGDRHNGIQDHSGASEDEPADGAPPGDNTRSSIHRDRVHRVPRGAGLPHPGTKSLGVKDAHQLTHPPPAKRRGHEHDHR
jgi:hypothetical protein